METHEQQVARVGANVAPRVTPDQIEAKIIGETFSRLTSTLTVCVLTLANGFTVTGESACASPENYNEEIGQRIARAQAKEKIWALEGYLLREKLAIAAAAGEPSGVGFTTYVGIKAVHAIPCTREEWCGFRGWALPVDEDGADEGYMLEYAPDGKGNVDGFAGYMSWSPKAVFERSYQAMNAPSVPHGAPPPPARFDHESDPFDLSTVRTFGFGQALEVMKAGERVARLGWNGLGMFAYRVPAASYPVQTGAAKAHFGEGALVPYRAYYALKTAQGDVATWSPSCSDIDADDWYAVV